MADVTVLLDRARAGDADAFDQVVSGLYGELRTIARAQRRRLGASDTINTTAVVHEAYARLGGGDFADRDHFLRVASRAMRSVIVDYARAQRAAKRGGAGRPVSLDAAGPVGALNRLDPTEVLSVNLALEDLERIDPESARITELRYFAGLTIDETAQALGLSPMTVKRRWAVARGWLYGRLAEAPPTR